jgi:hypothetical protein
MSLLKLIVIELLFAVRLAFKRENHYYNRCRDTNKDNVQMKLFIKSNETLYLISEPYTYLQSLLKEIGKVFVQYLQKEGPYMIAMVITYVGFRND